MSLPKNIAAYTENTVAPQYVSINKTLRGVEITVRSRPKDGQVYGPDATAVLTEHEFSKMASAISAYEAARAVNGE